MSDGKTSNVSIETETDQALTNTFSVAMNEGEIVTSPLTTGSSSYTFNNRYPNKFEYSSLLTPEFLVLRETTTVREYGVGQLQRSDGNSGKSPRPRSDIETVAVPDTRISTTASGPVVALSDVVKSGSLLVIVFVAVGIVGNSLGNSIIVHPVILLILLIGSGGFYAMGWSIGRNVPTHH